MANIASIATCSIVRAGVGREQVTPRALLRAMTRFKRHSYCVPPWTYDDYPHGRIYVQHGERWSPSGVAHAWERFGRYLEAIWVRWYDEGGDYDAIFAYTEKGISPSAWCRYGFDRVRVCGAPALGEVLPPSDWSQDAPGVWTAEMRGTYLAANDRSDIQREHPTLPGPTTPVPGRRLGASTLARAAGDMPAILMQLEPALLAFGTAIELTWRGRPTRVYQRRGERWWSFCLDDWGNCLADDWLAAQVPPRRP